MTDTQADSALALGMPPVDEVEPLASGDDTRELVNVAPAEIEPGDVYRHNGELRTVTQPIRLTSGEVALYFKCPHDGVPHRAVIGAGVTTVSVWRLRGGSYV